MKDHPNTSKAEVVKELSTRREEMRQRVVKFLNPEQLKTWDTEIGKAKQFLGQKMDN